MDATKTMLGGAKIVVLTVVGLVGAAMAFCAIFFVFITGADHADKAMTAGAHDLWSSMPGRCKANVQEDLAGAIPDLDPTVERCEGEAAKSRCFIRFLDKGIYKVGSFIWDCSKTHPEEQNALKTLFQWEVIDRLRQ